MNILVTGGNGFIATNFIKIALSQGHSITSLDNLSYAASRDNHALFIGNASYKFMHEDIRSENIYKILESNSYNVVVNFAAETHVDRSIEDDSSFISTNINVRIILYQHVEIFLINLFCPRDSDLYRFQQMKFMVR